jgi:hypothetical protein
MQRAFIRIRHRTPTSDGVHLAAMVIIAVFCYVRSVGAMSRVLL